MASNPDSSVTGAALIVNSVQVDNTSTFPATLTYTFPTSASAIVVWRTIGFGNADWQASCASGS